VDERYRVRSDAKFHIEQVGFLGDQFVAIYAHGTSGPLLEDRAEVKIEQPFNFQAAARSATELIQKVGLLVDTLNDGVSRLNATLLSETTLTNATRTIWNLKDFSERALLMVESINLLVATNSPALYQSLSNLTRFSTEVQMLAGELSSTVASNRTGFTVAVRDLQETTGILKEMATTVNAGEGVVGSLLRDQQLQVNVAQTMRNLSVLSSNIARYGLLHKPKKQKVERSSDPAPYSGRTPF
jgi:ABC-type transporter Mla subunit MlaD